ncbi:MAG: hypothetical protein K9N35_05755 [Candidatus Marinimicrobia bacterium]|nr:hypothetical protein [Candidatus Neomarinimicrobiota bacterium]
MSSLQILMEKPSKGWTRILLIVGVLIFIPVYTYIFRIFTNLGIDTNEFNDVWLSFDMGKFESFFEKLINQGSFDSFIASFKLNLLSMTGFMLTFFSLALMIARKISINSRMSRGAYVFPVIAVGIALLDIIPSFILVAVANETPTIPGWVVLCISGGLVIRGILLYALLLWMLIIGIYLLITRRRKGDTVEKGTPA